MNKRLVSVLLVMLSAFSFISALDFPAGGDYIFRLTNPELLSGAGSSAGGGFYSSGPSSIVMNPGLTANDQRVMLNLGYTALFNTGEDSRFGSGAQIALLIPSRWGVFSTTLDGIFCDVGKLNLGNLVHLRGGFSKDVTERLYAGIDLNVGVQWGDLTDWMIGFDMGFVYHWGNLGFLRDTRISGVLSGLGKPYRLGMPNVVTPKAGIAATLFSVANGNVAGAFSSDVSFPMFVNMVVDLGLQLRIARVITVKTGWQLNVWETAHKDYNLLPSVGVTVRFGINTKKNQFMIDKGWQQSEITTSAAWQNVYEGIHAASAGAAINLGLRDTDAPVIKMWNEE